MLFCSLPEELIARILALALAPARHVAPLLVSRQFFRIASPLFYYALTLDTPCRASRALDTLARHPVLAAAVRRVVLGGIGLDCARVLALCDCLRNVDICLDDGPGHDDFAAEEFCYALERCRTITQLTIRKDPAVYLTHPRPAFVLQRLAQAVRHWTNLETVHFAFRVSASPSTLPLARALSVSPRLRTVRAQLPAVWNDLLLVISTNPTLEKVMLYAEPMLAGPNWLGAATVRQSAAAITRDCSYYVCDDVEHAVLGTGMYMMEAKKHAKLSELVKSGTLIVRTRAHTTIATLSTTGTGTGTGTPLGAIRAKELADELMSGTAQLRRMAVV